MQELQAELARRGNSIPVSHSAEYRIDELLTKRIADNNLCFLPNDYMIIENAFLQEPWNLDQLIFDLQVHAVSSLSLRIRNVTHTTTTSQPDTRHCITAALPSRSTC